MFSKVNSDRLKPSSATLLLLRLVNSDPEEVYVVIDVLYAIGGGHKQQLDLYLPGGTSFPAIIFVHGGSLVSVVTGM